MQDNFIFAVNAVMPLVVLMAIGYLLRRGNVLAEGFFKSCDRLVFRLLLPISLFTNIYSVETIKNISWELTGFVLISIVAVVLLSLLTTRLFVREKESRGAACQCAFRSNTGIVGLPIAVSLGGAGAAAGMSASIAFGVPLYNLLAVWVLSIEGESKADFKKILKNIIKNPLIWGCFLGFGCLILRGAMPKDAAGEPLFLLKRDVAFFYSAIDALAGCTTPIALITIGGLLDFSRPRKGLFRNIVFGCLWRMVFAPVLVIGAALGLTRLGILNFTAAEFAVLIPFFATPAAVSSATMAAEMGADADLARQCVLWTSILLAFTLPLIIVIMRSVGLL